MAPIALAALALTGCILLVTVALVVTTLHGSTERVVPAAEVVAPTEPALGLSTPTVSAAATPTARCPLPLDEAAPLEQSLVSIFAGAPLRWGASVEEMDRSCGGTPTFHMDSCGARLVDMREATWPPLATIPARRYTSLAFFPDHGLFEVMVYSDATADELAAAVSRHLGPIHRRSAGHRFWDYPLGAERAREGHGIAPRSPGWSERDQNQHTPIASAYRSAREQRRCDR